MDTNIKIKKILSLAVLLFVGFVGFANDSHAATGGDLIWQKEDGVTNIVDQYNDGGFIYSVGILPSDGGSDFLLLERRNAESGKQEWLKKRYLLGNSFSGFGSIDPWGNRYLKPLALYAKDTYLYVVYAVFSPNSQILQDTNQAIYIERRNKGDGEVTWSKVIETGTFYPSVAKINGNGMYIFGYDAKAQGIEITFVTQFKRLTLTGDYLFTKDTGTFKVIQSMDGYVEAISNLIAATPDIQADSSGVYLASPSYIEKRKTGNGDVIWHNDGLHAYQKIAIGGDGLYSLEYIVGSPGKIKISKRNPGTGGIMWSNEKNLSYDVLYPSAFYFDKRLNASGILVDTDSIFVSFVSIMNSMEAGGGITGNIIAGLKPYLNYFEKRSLIDGSTIFSKQLNNASFGGNILVVQTIDPTGVYLASGYQTIEKREKGSLLLPLPPSPPSHLSPPPPLPSPPPPSSNGSSGIGRWREVAP